MPHRIARKLRAYQGLAYELEAFSPDVLFLHDLQFLSIRTVARYAESHPDVTVYVDGHTDFVNSARNWISRRILHGIVYRYCAWRIAPHVRKFYGVLPARVEFLQTMYGIPVEKTELLVLGADDAAIDLSRREAIRASVRRSLGIGPDDLVLVTGGRIDRRKSIHRLLRSFPRIAEANVKLILFGTPDVEMEEEITALSRHPSILSVGWIPAEKVYEYFVAADLGVFPGTHSVLWEQAVGVGLPCVFRRWNGIDHVNVGGNCVFLDTDDEADIAATIMGIVRDPELLAAMRQVAMTHGVEEFSYSEIAKRALAE